MLRCESSHFFNYKLALHVFALSEYMEVMLSKNFQAEYLNKIENEIREHAMKFRHLYTACFDKIELLKKEAVTTQAANKLADVSRSVGNFIGKIPLVKEGPVDEFLIDVGDSISDAEKKQLEKTLAFFIQYKDSGLTPIAEHITTINCLSNTPVVMLYNKKVLCFHELKVIQNSWGERWGDKGRREVPFDAIDYAYLLIDEVFNLNFNDVKETDWFYKAVKEAVFGGLMKGRSEDTFDPSAPCTRAEMAQFGVNLLKKIEEIQKIKEG